MVQLLLDPAEVLDPNLAQYIALKLHLATLPLASREGLGQGFDQALVGVTEQEPDTGKSTTAETLNELAPVGLILLAVNLYSQDIALAILVHPLAMRTAVLSTRWSRRVLIGGGGVVGFLSGLVGATIFLSLGLPPVAYIASEATTALAMHGVKTVVYHRYIALDREFWLLAALMGIAMVLGTWSAKRIIERFSREKFQRFVAILLATIAGYLVVHG